MKRAHHTSGDEVRFWLAGDTESLAEALAPPTCAVLEARPVDGRPCDATDTYFGANQLVLRVFSRTVSEHPIARLFVGALAARLDLDEQLVERTCVALQEAVTNALVHGNLELALRCTTDHEAFEAYFNEIDHRLNEAPWGERFVTVIARWSRDELTIDVEDQGTVWQEHNVAVGEVQLLAHGRGFVMMRATADRLSIDTRAPFQ